MTAQKPIWHSRHPQIEELRAVLGHDHMGDHLGIDITEIGPDFLIGTMPVDHRTKQPFGLLHGGASCVLSESLGSVGAGMCIDLTTHAAVGVEINANHLKSAREGTVTGRAFPLKLGRRLHVWQTDITDEAGDLICTSRLTVAIIERKSDD